MKKMHLNTWKAVAATMVLLTVAVVPSPATAKGKVSYKPGISLVPEVFRPDGVTDETYATDKGLSLWTSGQPIPKGDKIKLNVFAATGGGELKEIKVRVDNVLIADIAKAPWHTVLSTDALGVGVHMIEVWAVATGSNPQSTTLTQQFRVDPAVLVKGSQQYQGPNGQLLENPLPGTAAETFSDEPPQLPDYLKNQTQAPNAAVVITARSAASSEQSAGAAISDAPITVNEPTLFIVQPAPGSSATRYAYAIVRNGVTVSTSPQALRTAYDRIRIERRTDSQAGLRPGKVTLWIWGIDKSGNYTGPAKTYLEIPSDN